MYKTDTSNITIGNTAEQQLFFKQIREQSPTTPEQQTGELYVRLGCATCPHAVEFKVHGISSFNPLCSDNPEAAGAFVECVEAVNKKTQMLGSVSINRGQACPRPCTELLRIQMVIGHLNDLFGAGLEVPS